MVKFITPTAQRMKKLIKNKLYESVETIVKIKFDFQKELIFTSISK